jgi:hypothetical protein
MVLVLLVDIFAGAVVVCPTTPFAENARAEHATNTARMFFFI